MAEGEVVLYIDVDADPVLAAFRRLCAHLHYVCVRTAWYLSDEARNVAVTDARDTYYTVLDTSEDD